MNLTPSLHDYSPFLPFKTFMAVQNVQSWFGDMGLPSPQVAHILVKATFLFLSAFVSLVLAFKWRAARPEFGDNNNCRVPARVPGAGSP